MQDYFAVAVAPCSQAEAEALTNNTKPMTPLRTAQAVTASYYQKFVAAVDSPARRKLMAHYVCDGTADEVQIQAAIDDIAASGGEVVLEAGEFSITDTIAVTSSNISIVGRGRGTVLNPVWDENDPLDKIISFQGESGNYLDNVGCRDFSIVTDAPFDTVGNGGIIGVQWCRIWMQYCSNITVDNVHGTRVGFLLDTRTCNDIYVNNLTANQSAGPLAMVYCDRVELANIKGYDVKVAVDLAVCDSITAVNIQGQCLLTLPVEDFYDTGLDLGGVTNCTIANCNLNGFWYGISAKYEEEKFHNITIIGANITNCKAKGIHSDKNANGTGAKLGPMTITNCRVYSTVTGSQGIHLNGYSEDDSIIGCNINVHGYGILVEGSDNLTVIGNKVRSTNLDGIYVGKVNSTFESTNANVSNNLVSAGGAAGIWMSQCVNPTVENNHVVTAATHGVWMLECKRPTVRANRIDDVGATHHGIYVEWQGTSYLDTTGRTMRCAVDDNMVTGFGLRGILVSMAGVTGDPFSVCSVSRNQIFGDGANVGIAFLSSVTLESVFLKDNIIQGTLIPFYTVGATMGSSCRYSGNTGFLTESSGTATITNGNTTVVVNHTLGDFIYKALTPSAKDFSLTPTSDMGSASKLWVDTITTTQFTLNVDTDPGEDVDIGWAIKANTGF